MPVLTTLVSPAAIADNLIVAAPGATEQIVLLRYVLSASGGANTATWKSGATTIGVAAVLAANEKFGEGGMDRGAPILRCNPGQALNLALTAATVVGVQLSYMVV